MICEIIAVFNFYYLLVCKIIVLFLMAFQFFKLNEYFCYSLLK